MADFWPGRVSFEADFPLWSAVGIALEDSVGVPES